MVGIVWLLDNETNKQENIPDIFLVLEVFRARRAQGWVLALCVRGGPFSSQQRAADARHHGRHLQRHRGRRHVVRRLAGVRAMISLSHAIRELLQLYGNQLVHTLTSGQMLKVSEAEAAAAARSHCGGHRRW